MSSTNFIDVKKALSATRMATYEKHSQTQEQALALYHWNVQISACLFSQIHFLEITLRNAVCEALIATIGNRWVWDSSFAISLPNKIRDNLQKVASNNRITTLDKAIPELSFAFWQAIFTARFDVKIWDKQLMLILPNAPKIPYKILRKNIHQDLENLRELRNRIAHHEPIFQRNLKNDFDNIHKIISYRSQAISDLAKQNEQISYLLQNKP